MIVPSREADPLKEIQRAMIQQAAEIRAIRSLLVAKGVVADKEIDTLKAALTAVLDQVVAAESDALNKRSA